jgi:enamine deaminase RidA (YjgF/YER057c/UK114 family)
MNGCHFERDAGFSLWQSAKGSPEYYLTVAFDHPSDAALACRHAYRKIASIIEREKLAVVQERMFGSLNHYEIALAGRQQGLGSESALANGLVTYIQGRPLWGEGIAGIQIHAVRSDPAKETVSTITLAGRPVGRAWRRADATLYWLQNVAGLSQAGASPLAPKAQSEKMFLRAEEILRAQGLDYTSVVRTWIYLSDILSWYDGFNEVRNRLYGAWGLMPAPGALLRLPASTGIRGDNPLRAACVMDVLAIGGKTAQAPAITQLTNVKQKDAFGYQKAFSRGAWVRGGDLAQVQISGTAAIDERGESLFPGNARQQIQHTLEVVEALIQPCGARLADISGATFFLKSAGDTEICRQVLEAHSLGQIPAVWVVSDVCRGELLFEMDALALGPFA